MLVLQLEDILVCLSLVAFIGFIIFSYRALVKERYSFYIISTVISLSIALGSIITVAGIHNTTTAKETREVLGEWYPLYEKVCELNRGFFEAVLVKEFLKDNPDITLSFEAAEKILDHASKPELIADFLEPRLIFEKEEKS